MIICNTKAEVKSLIAKWQQDGLTHAAVPTMGALHEGHLSLVDTAVNHADRVIASIFVNPIQFGPSEDFDTYPRDLARDGALLEARGCHAVFAPAREEVFADDFSTRVSVSQVSEGFCGDARPGFFEGVATIVTKLFNILEPDTAVFGEKDFQQLAVIRRLVRDLDMSVKIVGAPTVREPDGLAMSSRNAYLSVEERQVAPVLHQAMVQARENLEAGAAINVVRDLALDTLIKAGFRKVDYFDLADALSLTRLDRADRPAQLLVAAWLGKTRLIDNISIAPSQAHHSAHE